jgi:hypothetical protein
VNGSGRSYPSPWPTIRATCARTSDGDVERLEHARGEALLLAQKAKQDVLGADVVVLEGPRLVLSKDYYLTSSLGEAFKHVFPRRSVRDLS